MFREQSTEKLIEYIQTLPDKEQLLIVARIVKSKNAGGKKKSAKGRKSQDEIKKMGSFLDTLGSKLPKKYKFNRQEANER